MKLHPRLIALAKATGWSFLIILLFGILGGGLTLFQAFQLSRVISGVFIDHHPLAVVSNILFLIVAVIFLRVLFSFLENLFAGRAAIRIKTDLRRSLLEKIERLGPVFLSGQSSGELVTTALLGVESLEAYFAQYLPQVILAAVLPLVTLVVVFPLDLLTGLIFLLTAPLIPLFMVLIGWAAEALTKKQWLNLTRLGDFFMDSLQGIATLKMLGRSKDRGVQILDNAEEYRAVTLSVLRITFLSALALELVATISTAVIAVEIGLRLLYSRIEFQQAFFILLIAPEFYLPLRNLSARYHAGMRGVTAAAKIFEVLDVPELEAVIDYSGEPLANQFNGSFAIEFKNVTYTYPGAARPALQNINLVLRANSHYALVGKSGSGKTTLAYLLLRFIDPQEGEITLNGIDTRSWTGEEWRKFLGWVPQNPMLFNASFQENLTLGRDDYDLEVLLSTAKTAGLESVVKSLSDGMQTNLGESGNRLSGGEAQRLAIARALLKDPRLILLDEPTSHLDPMTEKQLLNSMEELCRGRTTLTIAHRWSTVRTVDEVIFLRDSRLAGFGNHQSLLENVGAYAELVKAGGVQ